MCGPQHHWLLEAKRPGSTKNRARGSGRPTTRRLLRSLTERKCGAAQGTMLSRIAIRSRFALWGWRTQVKTEATAHDGQNTVNDYQDGPDQHDLFDAQS